MLRERHAPKRIIVIIVDRLPPDRRSLPDVASSSSVIPLFLLLASPFPVPAPHLFPFSVSVTPQLSYNSSPAPPHPPP